MVWVVCVVWVVWVVCVLCFVCVVLAVCVVWVVGVVWVQGRSTRYDWYDHGRTTFRKGWSARNVQNRNKKISIHGYMVAYANQTFFYCRL